MKNTPVKVRLTEKPAEINKGNIEEALQQAIELELATIPTYLYTYYSIIRSWGTSPGQGKDTRTGRQILVDTIKNDLSKGNKNKAEELARGIQVYANKAAALIMSVVVEEMLHLALSSNVKQAIIGPPLIYDVPLNFPTYLPGHIPEFAINLAKFSKAQLITFLKIESPLPFAEESIENDKNALPYSTIGEFYKKIEECILDNFPGPYTSGRPQLIPGQSYYAQNTINTVYYDKNHNPRFPNADDSGDLIHVVSCETALVALEEIVEQGEGHTDGDHLNEEGKPIIPKEEDYWDDKSKINPEDWDDPDQLELSHFDRFLELYSEAYFLDNKFRESMGLEKLDDKDDKTEYVFTKYFVKNQPDNPRTRKAPKHVTYDGKAFENEYIQGISDMANAIYSYILLMVESCYYKDGNTQYEIFMMGIHKSMIWLLSEFGEGMGNLTFTSKKDKKTYNAAVTFEGYDFQKRKSRPKAQLIEMAQKFTKSVDNWNKAHEKEIKKGILQEKNDYSWLLSPAYLPLLPDVDVKITNQGKPNEIREYNVKEKPFLPTVS